MLTTSSLTFGLQTGVGCRFTGSSVGETPEVSVDFFSPLSTVFISHCLDDYVVPFTLCFTPNILE